MKYGFVISRRQANGVSFWVAESELDGVLGQGDTIEEALSELEENENAWIAVSEECGDPIPEPKIEELQLGPKVLSVRLPRSIHKDMSDNAQKEGISLNQYIANAVLAYNMAKSANNYIERTLVSTRNSVVSSMKEMTLEAPGVSYLFTSFDEKSEIM